MDFTPISTLDFNLLYLFVYEELDRNKVEDDNIASIMKHKAPFDLRRETFFKTYHIIEVNMKQVLASFDAHIVS
jgi:hypothetical protein